MSAISNNISHKGSGVENSMLSILFIAGILGAFYFLRQPGETLRTSIENNTIEKGLSGASTKIADEKKNSYLLIDGAMEQEVPIRFTISAFNEQVRYVLDLGNGIRREFSNAEMNYTYRESGAFRVRLIAMYRGSEKLLFSDVLYISRNSEVAGGY